MNTRPLVALRATLAALMIGAPYMSVIGHAAPGGAQQPAQQPAPAQPAPAQPPPTQPSSTQPAPAQPPPAQPAPAQPVPGQPTPAQPAPGQPPPEQTPLGQTPPGQPAPVLAPGQGVPAAQPVRIVQPPLAPPMPIPPASQASEPPSQAAPILEQLGGGSARPMTVDEAVQLALEQNLDVQVERINPQLQDLTIQQVAGAWAPNLSGSLNYSNATAAPRNALSGGDDAITSQTFFGTAGWDQLLPFGTQYNIGFDAQRFETNSLFSTFNPQLISSLSFSLAQPLLRGLRIDGTRASYMVQKKNREISDIALRGQIVSTMRLVRNAYWNLVGSRYNLVVAQASLDISRQTLKDNRTRVEVGTMAPIDIVQAEAEVARNEEAAIIAASQIDTFEDQLRALIFDPKEPEFWTMDLDLTEAPRLPTTGQDVDIDGAIRNAFQKRTDLLQTRKNLEAQQINIRFYADSLKPTLNGVLDYGLEAVGGVELVRDNSDPFNPGPVTGQTEKRFGSVLGDLFARDFPTWTVGVQFAMPLFNSQEKAQYTRSRLAYNQTELALRSAELSVATEVRAVGRNVNTNRRRVDSTRAARVLTERQLEAAQKKFSVGLATSLDVLVAQRDLTNARNNELTAVIDYVKSLVDFEAVQEAGTGGSGLVTGPTTTGNGGSTTVDR